MKRISLFAIISLVMISCSQDPYEGYIVFKHYVGRHMCHDDFIPTTSEASVLPNYVHTHTHVHHHEEIEPTWVLYVGNAQGTTQIDVTEDCYNGFSVTDKVIVTEDNVELIKKGCR
jgi:hypothetical protein